MSRIKIRCKMLVMMLVLLMSVCCISVKADAATPRLMISDYKIVGGKIVGGQEFNMKLTLKNTAAKTTVKNVKVTLSTENGEFLPVDSAGTAYVESIAGDGEQELSFTLKAVKGLEEKSYKLMVKTEYEGSSGMEYTVDETLFLPITMEQRLSVTDLFLTGDNVYIGDSVELTAKVNNLGEGSLYNVTAKWSGQGIDEMTSHIGTVEPGKSANVDIITLASELTKEVTLTSLYVTYEDIDGVSHTEELKLGSLGFQLNVSSPVYDDLEKIKGDDTKKVDWTLVKWMVVVVIVVIVVAVVIIRRAKRKKKILEEF